MKDFCVICIPDQGNAGEAPHGVFVLEATSEGVPGETREHEAEAAVSARARQLPTHQRLRGVQFWDGGLPRTSTLKLKRRQIRAALADTPRGASKPRG